MADSKNTLDNVSKHLPEATIPPMVGVGAISLQMALQYHDINTVQDGALYQQYKIEGRNLRDLHLDIVFDTATRIERHLMSTSDRIAGMVVDTLLIGAENESSISQMIDDFINEEVPQHPEPWLLRENYLEIPKDIFPVPEQIKFEAFEKALGLEEHELVLYTGIMSEMTDEKKDLLLSKIDWCIRFDEIQTLITDVLKHDIDALPEVNRVFEGYTASMMEIDGIPDEDTIKSRLLLNFKETAGILTEEYPMFDKSLSYFDAEEFHNALNTIYLK
jgi:hypothetical protein